VAASAAFAAHLSNYREGRKAQGLIYEFCLGGSWPVFIFLE
jgi:hypothetical protein